MKIQTTSDIESDETMAVVEIKLLGSPKIFKDGVQIFLPFRKAEALLYFLALKKQASRDLLVNLLWGGIDEEVAKKNLRNAVYIIRKAFDEDILVSPQRHTLMLSTSHTFQTDLDLIQGEPNMEQFANYDGDFLEGFMVKEAEVFEDWMAETRESFRNAYIQRCNDFLSTLKKESRFPEAEKIGKILIAIDEFNEDAYRELMVIYGEMGKYGKCLDVFNELTVLLKKELSISPDEKTVEVYESVMAKRTMKSDEEKNSEEEFFYGRKKELELIRERMNGIRRRGKNEATVIIGEAGVGKSKLLREALKAKPNSQVISIQATCYQAEEDYPLKPWNGIFEGIGKLIDTHGLHISENLIRIVSCVFPTFSTECMRSPVNDIANLGILQYQVAEKAIVDIVRRVSEKIPLIICFEDLQWMDDMSLALLKSCIFQSGGNQIVFIMTCRDAHRKRIEKVLVELGARGELTKIPVGRLSERETAEFARGYLPEYLFSPSLELQIAKETEGNPFFIIEYLNGLREGQVPGFMSGKIKDIISSRIMNVSDEGKKILNLASLYFDRAPFEDILAISGKSEDETAELIDELQERFLIREVEEGSVIYILFTHQKLREFIYQNISPSKKRILHSRIAQLFEGKLENIKTDTLLYSKLIYHFECAGNKMAALKYRLKDLNEYVHISHELFPVLDKGDIEDKKCFYLTKTHTAQRLKAIGDLVADIKSGYGWDKNELLTLEIQYLYLYGRGLIREGENRNGVEAIRSMIEKASSIGDYLMALKGYRSLVYDGINTLNMTEIEENLERALTVAKEYKVEEEIITLHRLEGILAILRGNFGEGERILWEVIEEIKYFKEKERLVLIEAGALNYLGESRKRQQKYEDALKFYEEAIGICRSNGLMISATIFYANATQIAYLLKDYHTAIDHFEHAIHTYSQFDYPWGKATAYCYAALVRLEQGQYEECLSLMNEASTATEETKNMADQVALLRVKTQMAYETKLNNRASLAFRHFLKKEGREYCGEGLMLTEPFKELTERAYFEKMESII